MSKQFKTKQITIQDIIEYLNSLEQQQQKDVEPSFNPEQLKIDFFEDYKALSIPILASFMGISVPIMESIIEAKNPKELSVGMLTELFMAIGLYYDSHYPGHIRDSEEVYTFNFVDKKLVKVENPINIKTFAFPAFRSLKEGKIACSFLSKVIKYIYK